MKVLKLKIAIQADDYTSRKNPDHNDASSPKWSSRLIDLGHEVKWVDVYQPNIINQLEGCDGFMWRWSHRNGMRVIARRLLPVIEEKLGLSVYPNQSTCWHFDDKIAQSYLLVAADIPVPETLIFFDRDDACKWAANAKYPIVLKLATGAGSSNVRLLHSAAEAYKWIDRLFYSRVTELEERCFQPLTLKSRLREAVRILYRGTLKQIPNNGLELETGYAFFQEFLDSNRYDTRVTIIGHRAFSFRRYNRDNDFRASGSGKIDWNSIQIDSEFIWLGYLVSRALNMQSCAIDFLYKQNKPVVTEVSYTFASWAVYECPGHWELDGDLENGEFHWVEGNMWPEEAQVDDFIKCIQHKKRNVQKNNT